MTQVGGDSSRPFACGHLKDDLFEKAGGPKWSLEGRESGRQMGGPGGWRPSNQCGRRAVDAGLASRSGARFEFGGMKVLVRAGLAG